VAKKKAKKKAAGQNKVTPWTPGISFGNGTTGITYVNQLGNFTRIGRLVVANYKIVLSSKGSSVGAARITGLPVVSGSLAAKDPFSSIGYWSNMATSYASLSAGIESGTTRAQIFGASGATATLGAVANTDFANNSSIQGTLLYYAK